MTNISQPRRTRFFVVFLILFFYANTTLHAQGLTAAERFDALDSRVQALDDELKKLSSSTSLTNEQRSYYENLKAERATLSELLSDMRKVSLSIASREVSLSGQYFQIFLALIALASAIGLLIGIILQRGIREYVIKKAEKYIDEEVKSYVRREFNLAIAVNYSQLSYTWWEHYEPEYQNFLRHGICDRRILPEIRLSRVLADKGLYQINQTGIDKEKDERAWTAYARLKNHWVYNRTAEILVSKKEGHPVDDYEVEKLIETANECERLARDKRATTLWYDIIETSAFCYIKLDSEVGQKLGRKMIREFFEKKPPRKDLAEPPFEWLSKRYEEYFPTTVEGSEQRKDPLGLGNISPPQKQND